jgi:hypothetical protein
MVHRQRGVPVRPLIVLRPPALRIGSVTKSGAPRGGVASLCQPAAHTEPSPGGCWTGCGRWSAGRCRLWRLLGCDPQLHVGAGSARRRMRGGACRNAPLVMPGRSGLLPRSAETGPPERWLWVWELSNSIVWPRFEMAMSLFTPHQLNPFGPNPLRHFLTNLLDCALLSDPRAAAHRRGRRC